MRKLSSFTILLTTLACAEPVDYTIDWYATLPDSVYADVDVVTRHIRIGKQTKDASPISFGVPKRILRDHERCHLAFYDANFRFPDLDSLNQSKLEEKACDAIARYLNR